MTVMNRASMSYPSQERYSSEYRSRTVMLRIGSKPSMLSYF